MVVLFALLMLVPLAFALVAARRWRAGPSSAPSRHPGRGLGLSLLTRASGASCSRATASCWWG
jgi:hypothetical protein